MIKLFAYIVLLLIFASCLSSANAEIGCLHKISDNLSSGCFYNVNYVDTVTSKNNKKLVQEDKGKIKEVTKAKRQPKPEKIEPIDNTDASKSKQRPKDSVALKDLKGPLKFPGEMAIKTFNRN